MSQFKPMPPVEELKAAVNYDPEIGFIGSKAKGYSCVGFKGQSYASNRVAYYLGTGIDPGRFLVDHIDRDPSNNKLSNLRLATPSQNRMNAPRRAKGWVKVKSGYSARIWVPGKGQESLGVFPTAEEATAAYEKRLKEVHTVTFLNAE